MNRLFIFTLILFWGCNKSTIEQTDNKVYSKKLLELEKYNGDEYVIEGTPTYDRLINNPLVTVEYIDHADITKKIGRNELNFKDSSNYIFSDSFIVISKTVLGADAGKVVDLKKSDSEIIIKTYQIELIDTTNYIIGEEPGMSDLMCLCVMETKIKIKIESEDKCKKVVFNGETIKPYNKIPSN